MGFVIPLVIQAYAVPITGDIRRRLLQFWAPRLRGDFHYRVLAAALTPSAVRFDFHRKLLSSSSPLKFSYQLYYKPCNLSIFFLKKTEVLPLKQPKFNEAPVIVPFKRLRRPNTRLLIEAAGEYRIAFALRKMVGSQHIS